MGGVKFKLDCDKITLSLFSDRTLVEFKSNDQVVHILTSAPMSEGDTLDLVGLEFKVQFETK